VVVSDAGVVAGFDQDQLAELIEGFIQFHFRQTFTNQPMDTGMLDGGDVGGTTQDDHDWLLFGSGKKKPRDHDDRRGFLRGVTLTYLLSPKRHRRLLLLHVQIRQDDDDPKRIRMTMKIESVELHPNLTHQS